MSQVSQDELRSRVVWLQGFGTRVFTSPQCADAAAGILQYFQQLGLDTAVDSFRIPGYSLDFSNIVATKPGRTDPSKVYIIGAHYDSTARGGSPSNAPGADDNATGTAAVMEIARVLSAYSFDYTITFVAFGAEEAGYYGSQHFVDGAVRRGDQILGFINLDMIGYVDKPVEDIDLATNPASRWLAERFAATAPQYVNVAVAITPGTSGESDHESFWKGGYSAVMAIEDDPLTNPNYHKTSDVIETLDVPFFTATTKAALAVLADLAQPAGSPAWALTPSALRFGATKGGAAGALASVTGPQAVTVTFSGAPSAWTATTTDPWLQIGSGSAPGSGQFTVSIANPGNAIGGNTTLSGRVTITASAGADAALTLPVTLTVDQTGGAAAQPPFGQIDTPAQNASGVQGAIGVTGWALDDVGVNQVQIYRNCLPSDLQRNCESIEGERVVWVGNAAFLPGARPDVEAAFPDYPQAHRAGWGYLLLTNMLPDVVNQTAYGGEGAITLYALARAADFNGGSGVVWLGRSRLDHTPTTIRLANASIAKPFGAIDTPGQGQTVSGTLANFGWALTPDSNTTAEAGDIVIPTNGSSMVVFIDGVATGPVAYNQCRGSVGNPVPAGLYCDDDVASIFGNPAPRPTFTTRPGNPTKYRNLDAARAAIGACDLDTTTLSNGLHTIAWSVTDSAGRVEGIGSRFFTVLNSAPGRPDAAPSSRAASGVFGHPQPRVPSPDQAGQIRGRTGFDLRAPYETVPADGGGVRHIQLAELGRIELDLGPVDAGYLVANGTRRELPAGAHLEGATGQFTWAPGPGYVGTYRLTFVRAGTDVPVAVTVRPVNAPAEDESEIRMHVDLPREGEPVSGALRIAGWALDPQAAIGSGIGAVHVWAHRRDVPGAAPEFLGAATLGGSRPDVAQAFGQQFGSAAFDLTTASLAPGTYDLTVHAWNRRTARWDDARRLRVIVW